MERFEEKGIGARGSPRRRRLARFRSDKAHEVAAYRPYINTEAHQTSDSSTATNRYLIGATTKYHTRNGESRSSHLNALIDPRKNHRSAFSECDGYANAPIAMAIPDVHTTRNVTTISLARADGVRFGAQDSDLWWKPISPEARSGTCLEELQAEHLGL